LGLSAFFLDEGTDLLRMGTPMGQEPDDTEDLLQRAAAGDDAALPALWERHRARLRQMVRLRLDRRLQGRVDPSDVLQEAYLDLAERLPDYARDRPMLAYLWLRLVTGQRLMQVHRFHLGAAMRDAGREVSLYRGALPAASSASLAAQLLGRLNSASQAAIRAERQLQLQEVLNGMDPMDREILALRHFEELSNGEAAEVLGLSKTAANNRYIRALGRLRDLLERVPRFFDEG
jgi:RNA polymerase sigma-70 factor (ECF subfamily)